MHDESDARRSRSGVRRSRTQPGLPWGRIALVLSVLSFGPASVLWAVGVIDMSPGSVVDHLAEIVFPLGLIAGFVSVLSGLIALNEGVDRRLAAISFAVVGLASVGFLVAWAPMFC